MTIASLPAFFDMNYTDKEGKLTTDAHFYNDQMFQTLNYAIILLNSLVNSAINNNTITNNGVQFPQYTTAQITTLAATSALGTVWFNTTLAKLQVLTAAGVVQPMTST